MPSQVFTGQHIEISQTRQKALDLSYLRHPERFVKGPPSVKMPPATVYINPALDLDGQPDPKATVNFPTLERVKSKLTSNSGPKHVDTQGYTDLPVLAS